MPSRPFDAIAELLLRTLCRRRRITIEPYERRSPRTTRDRVSSKRVIAGCIEASRSVGSSGGWGSRWRLSSKTRRPVGAIVRV